MKDNVIVSHKETIESIFSFMRTYINHFALLIKPIPGLLEWCPIDSLICLSSLPAKKKKKKLLSCSDGIHKTLKSWDIRLILNLVHSSRVWML